ncbi:MAG TPA: hypothetical protein VFN26_07580 [Candidatus Acidoferrum sp.]|nr:hypothetical protein [Candidatus Acidoferrum sp.]
MKLNCLGTALLLFFITITPLAAAQDEPPPTVTGAPPQMLVLVHREFVPGKAAERRKLEASVARACNQLVVPNSWIDLESITGPPEALSLDPFDSFDQVEAAFADWMQIFGSRPDLARMQGELDALVSSERTIIAARRDDLGYRPQSIDFSKARFVRVLEVRVFPGRASDFAESMRILAGGYEKINADTPWVVYQVNAGMPSPAFLVFLPMRALVKNDDLLEWRRILRDAEGEDAAQRMEQIARDAYASTESNLYFISPEMSHVTREFADGDPAFWSSKPAPAAKPAAPKNTLPKPER